MNPFPGKAFFPRLLSGDTDPQRVAGLQHCWSPARITRSGPIAPLYQGVPFADHSSNCWMLVNDGR